MEAFEIESKGRSYQLSGKKRKQKTRKIKKLTAGSMICLHFFLIKYQVVLEKLGQLVVKHPKKLIATLFFLLVVVSCLGIVFMSPSNLQDEFFQSEKGNLVKDFTTAGRYFPKINSRQEEVILTPVTEKGNNVLSSACLKDALLVHRSVINSENFQNVCMAARETRYAQNVPCMMTNPLELCNVSKNAEHCLEVITREWKNSSRTLSDGRTFKFDQELFVSDLQINEENIISARAIRLIFFLKNPPKGDQLHKTVLSWEESFIKKMEELRSNMTCATLDFTSYKDHTTVATHLFSFNVVMIALTYAILFFISILMISSVMTSIRPAILILGCLVTMCVAIGLVSTVSISYLVTVNIWQCNWMMITFLYCKGITDALILIQDMHQQRHIPSVEHRITSCMTKSGMALSTSNLISIMVFGLAQMSSFPVFREFSFVALINVLFYYLIFLVLLMACLCLWLRKFRDDKMCCSRAVGSTNYNSELSDNDTQVSQVDTSACCQLTEIYGKIICSKPAAVLVLMLFIGLVSCSSYLVFRQKQVFDSPLMINPTADGAKFLSMKEKLFNQERVKILFSGSLNYSNSGLRKTLQEFGETLSNGHYSERPVDSWINRFEEWAKQQGLRCTGTEFNDCLRSFLGDPQNAVIREDLNLSTRNDTLHLVASYFNVYMISSKEFSSNTRSLKSLRSDTTNFQLRHHLQVSIASHFLEKIEQLTHVERECIWLTIATGMSATILLLFFAANPRIALVLGAGFVAQVLELMSLLHLWDVPVNYISVLCISLGFIISINLSIQMSQIRALSVDTTAQKRTMNALNSTGTAIFFGGVLAIVSSIGLGFIYPNLALIFHKVLPILFVLGLFHSQGYIPAALLVTSKPMEACARAMAPSSELPQHRFEMRQQQDINQDFSGKDSFQKERPSDPGVAILGISCRFPNAENKDFFWDMLAKGKCGFQNDYPANRPSEHKEYHMLYNPKRFTQGRLCALGGAYLNNIRDFDAEFFNISSQEAKAMDPQQRILLQIAYEAIEDAGLRLEDLQKGKTGVFVGAMNLDYASRATKPDNLTNLNQFHSTGVTSSILANRVSFCLNLTGPSLTVDTACSSSLVALKIASQCLQSGECDVAIVCAPNIILDPSVQIIFSVGGLLAPDGRCKSFDASGDGYGRGEGFAAVVLKLTEAAVMDKDDIYCEIIACSMNNDGQHAVPITAPSSQTQAELSQKVLEESGLDADDIEYLEAHGTGTAIGDVVEIKSVSKTYCSKASGNNRVLRIGSVKSNLNHTESASGLAGLIKVALMLKNKIFVPTVNIQILNPKLKLAEKGMKVQDVCEPWIKRGANPRTAALNSFGYGGSNVHAILREFPEIKCNSEKESSRETLVLTLSAHSKGALTDMAQQHAKWLNDNPEHEKEKGAICWSLNTRRSQYEHRLAVVFETLQDAANMLQLFGEAKTGWEDHVAVGKVTTQHSRPVFVFEGQGSNWYGMGRQLIKCEPLFRQIITKISSMIQGFGETWSLEDELFCQENTSKLTGIIIGEPATFAIQYATAKLLESWGIAPAAVVGHSIGELAACCVAGALTLEEALRVILVRSRCHELCPSYGSMAALGMSEEAASQLIIQLKLEGSISIAAINDGNSVTISGDHQSVECVQTHLQLNNIHVFWKDLHTKRAFHSRHEEMVRDSFQSQMKSIHLHPQATTIPFYSTVTGDIISGKTMDEDYWWRNFRQPVQFFKAVQNILRDNFRMAVEVSPQPSLGYYITRIAEQETHSSQSGNVVCLATHPRKSVKAQHKAFLHNTVGRLYTMGYSIDWDLVQGEEGNARFIRTPTYPWQKKDYWHIQDEQPKLNESVEYRHHAFLADVKPTESFTGLKCWKVEVDLHNFPYMRDHALTQGGPVFPGAACVEMAIAMAVEQFSCDEVTVKNTEFTNVLTIPENQVRLLQLQLQDGKDVATADFTVKTIPGDGSEITLARGEIAVVLGKGKMRKLPRHDDKGSFEEIQVESETDIFKNITSKMRPVPLSEFKELTMKYGFNFGPCFSLIKMIWRGIDEAVCSIEIDREDIKNEMDRYIVHPSILDACLQTSVAVEEDKDGSETRPTTFPVRIKGLLLLDRNIPERTICHVSKQTHGNWITYNIHLMDLNGKVLIAVEGFQSAEMSTLIRSQRLENVAYEMKWVESAIEVPEQPQANAVPDVKIVLNDSQGIGKSFSDLLKKKIPAAKVVTVENLLTDGNLQGDISRAIQSAIASAPTPDGKVQLINFLPVDAGLLPESYEAIDHSQTLSFVSSLQILQALLNGNLENTHLVMVTRNSQAVTSEEDVHFFPWASSVLGLRRTASLEYTNIRCTTVDLSNEFSDLDLLAREVQAETSEDEIVFRTGKRFVNRITGLEKSSTSTRTATGLPKSNTNQSVFITLHPTKHEVCLKRNTWPRLSEDKIQVNVACTWMVDGNKSNLFSDAGVLGFSGQVYLVGTDKAGVQVGDEVCGVANISYVGNQIQVDADHVIHKPKGMTDTQAATLPVCMAIAFYVIRRTVDEKKNMFLYIDDTNSGLGRVTVLVAKALGHTVLSGLQERPKKSFYPGMISAGEKHLSTEKQAPEVDAVIFFTKPESKVIQESCQLLKAGGKLVILNEDVSGSITIPTGKKITCERISFAEMLQKPHTLSKLWTPVQELMLSAGLENQVLQITQHTLDVIQYFHEAKGKDPRIMSNYLSMTAQAFATLTFGNSEQWKKASVEILPPGIDQRGLKPDRSYMIVGGMRGFGFEVAKWMAYSGAKTIVLVARSQPSESKLSEVSHLMSLTGANIILHQADASIPECMKALEQRLETLPSVAGIVHTAMVLKDEMISSLDISSFRDVAAPKIKGAFLLHEMSLQMDLDFFVLFSSIASLLGNPGQASYAAANAFLDGLAQHRQHVLGLPAVSINWGPIKGAGVLQREGAIAEHLSRAGYFLLPAAQAIQYMEQVLLEETDRAQLGLCDVDWQKIQKSTPGLAKSTRLAYIRNERDSTENTEDMQQLASRLVMEKDPRKQAEMVQEYVIDLLCSWTGNAPSELDFNSSLYNYGMDSFSSLTFKMQLESSLQLSFEVFYFTQPDTTPAKMVQDIIAKLRNSPAENEVHRETVTTNSEPAPGDFTQRKTDTEETTHPMDKASDSATYHLIPLFKPEEAKVKLFCVHPAGRYAMNLAPISNGFTQQSLVAFYAIGYTEPTMRADNRSVRELAQSYIRMIKEIQRHGPYYLAGQSFGGLVAYEMANILTEQCQDVAFVAMIDTFPWYLLNRTGAARLEMLFSGTKLDKLMDGLFEATFEQVLSKLASTSLQMTTDEYKALRERETLADTIKFLQQRATDNNIPLYDITLLQGSIQHDNKMATRKHREWRPPEVMFKGPLTYLKSADQRYTPTRPLQESSDVSWSLLVDGNIDVYICPGDHLALSEPEDAATVGGILATAVSIRYVTLCPSLPRLPASLKQRRAIRKFEAGVDALLYSKKASKSTHKGTLYLDVRNQTLAFKTTPRRSDKTNQGSDEKKIPMKGLRNVLPGKYEPSALKIASKTKETSEQHSINLLIITSVVASKRAYNFEWYSYEDMREFFVMVEAIMGVTIFKL